ncbi:hypothetical protein EMIHUDRAFT_446585 [Emiliania huxleyi CCMP1516]|uniref:Uncharacterized protein n=2 Tax=Emiliania huxleyi TaxID=2903 RepID=A0A0D3I2R4_EMIH1|nr:hypothetical protein EMIHUDRAFT_446585 [Emiliania huxleyi CCMP1516]EOD05549.1 hypothetical protein EMIHUDRAFT_446585 [Emiliania huxleyi CCMP1516]|eukprot:XP_005757978.1 hypothetical protein EMIHUDRAFT_446585 [Emiliania huxleyi CCMP1516]
MKTGEAESDLAGTSDSVPLGLPVVSASGVAMGRRVSEETNRRVTVIVEEARARGGDNQPSIPARLASATSRKLTLTATRVFGRKGCAVPSHPVAASAALLSLAVGTAASTAASAAALVLGIIEVSPEDWWFQWVGLENDAEGGEAAVVGAFLLLIEGLLSLVLLLLKLALLFSASLVPAVVVQTLAFRRLACLGRPRQRVHRSVRGGRGSGGRARAGRGAALAPAVVWL